MYDPLPGLAASISVMVLDPAAIPAGCPPEEDVAAFLARCSAAGIDPRAPASRQRFHDELARSRGTRYLLGRWGEDRAVVLQGTPIATSGRTVHLGVDVFAGDCAPVLAPCDGRIVRAGFEPAPAGYGHWRIVEPGGAAGVWIFYGHLGADAREGGGVRSGEPFARLGDFPDENGGWSRHLHLQMLTALPSGGDPPPGYAAPGDRSAPARFPDPGRWFAGVKPDTKGC
jgi:murein DD-endopeptidase MepM/ murein hydrolase activator NlpD